MRNKRRQNESAWHCQMSCMIFEGTISGFTGQAMECLETDVIYA